MAGLLSVARWFDHRALSIALIAGGAIHLLQIVISADAMVGYPRYDQISAFSPWLRIIVIAAISAVLMSRATCRGLRVDALVSVLAAYVVSGILVGMVAGEVDYVFGRHAFAGVTMLTSYWLGVYLAGEIAAADRGLRVLAWLTLAGTLVALFLGAHMLGKPHANLAVSAPLLLTFDVVLRSGSIWLAILCIVIFVLSNNRSIMIGASAMLALWLVERYRASWGLMRRIVYGAALTMLLFTGTMVVSAAVSKFTFETMGFAFADRAVLTVDGVVALVSKAFSSAGLDGDPDPDRLTSDEAATDPVRDARPGPKQPTSDDAAMDPSRDKSLNSEQLTADKAARTSTFDRITSARWTQMTGVFDAIRGSPLTLLLGGFGHEAKWVYYSRVEHRIQTNAAHQVDPMPGYLLLTGGFIFAVAIMALIAWKMLIAVSKGGATLGRLFLLGFGATMLLSMQPNTPLFWIMLGAFGQNTVQKSQRR